jgi:3-oxoadipate enol-lactonase
MNRAERRPVRLHREIDGPLDAPALLLLDSIGTRLEMWDPQKPELARSFRVVRSDLRGHGGSPAPPGPYSIDDLGTDVIELMDELAIERAHVGGLSLGGMIAMWLAANHPDRIDRLVLICTSARLGPAESWLARAATVRSEGTSSISAAVVGRWFTPAFAAARPDLIARMRAMVDSISPEGYAGCCEAIAAMDQTGDLGRIEAPTLVLAGADDPAIPADHGALIVERVQRGRFVVVPEGAHLLNYQQPEIVTRLIVEHLAAVPEVSR